MTASKPATGLPGAGFSGKTLRAQIFRTPAVRAAHGRTKLMTGCALAVTLVAAAQSPRAHAQVAPGGKAFQGTGISTVAGAVTIVQTNTIDTVTVNSSQAIVDWTPDDNATGGGPISFLPAGKTGLFTNGDGVTNYVVLNRIVPTDTTRAIRFDGTVRSQIQANPDVAAQTGGSVWFYSPGGIIAGSTAVFDVGSLVLTANAVDTSGGLFGPKGEIRFSGASGSQSAIRIDAGAQLRALNANSYIAMVAPQIIQNGNVQVNGSVGYVAAEAANVTINNGLFDIAFVTGTTVGNAISHGGTTGGPSSTGAGDNHGIYFATMAKNDAVSMLLTGSIGYQAAASADIVNGVVVLSAGYDVQGGVVAVGQSQETGAASSSIAIGNSNFTSDITGYATDKITANPTDDFGTITMGSAFLSAINSIDVGVGGSLGGGQRISVGGSLYLQATGKGDGAQRARLFANSDEFGYGSGLSVQGGLTVDANGLGAGGLAAIDITDNGLFVNGSTRISADGVGGDGVVNGSDGQGGIARLTVSGAGSVRLDDVTVSARGTGGTGASDGRGGSGTGGNASIGVDGGSLTALSASVLADGLGGSSGIVGGDGTGGTAAFTVNSGTVNVGPVTISANGFGGAGAEGGDFDGDIVLAGNGGIGRGGTARLSLLGGSITGSTASVSASGFGGSGGGNFEADSGNGGDGIGGDTLITIGANANVVIDTLAAIATGTGGDGGDIAYDYSGYDSYDFSDDAGAGGAGSGGLARILITGNSASGSISLVQTSANSGGAGGAGGDFGSPRFRAKSAGKDGLSTIAFGLPGSGGDAAGGTALIEISGDATAFGNASVSADAQGGDAADGGLLGPGGSATGGLATLNLSNTTYTADLVSVSARATGGDGATAPDGQVGNGGAANGGTALLALTGAATVATVAGTNVTADAVGGTGAVGGTAGGGIATATIVDGAWSGTTAISADALGGAATTDGLGGDGTGGTASFVQTSGNASVGTLGVSATGRGGLANIVQETGGGNGGGGSGNGGTASVSIVAGAFAARAATVDANGTGADGTDAFQSDAGNAGSGRGGIASFTIASGVTATVGDILARASGIGGAGGNVDYADFGYGYDFSDGPGTAGAGDGGIATIGLAGAAGGVDLVSVGSARVDTGGIGGAGGQFNNIANAPFAGGNGSGFGIFALGGPGSGGDASGGTATLTITGDGVDLGSADVLANAVAGDGAPAATGGAGGSAVGGAAAFRVTDADFTIFRVNVTATATAGNGASSTGGGAGGDGGNATGGTALIEAFGVDSDVLIGNFTLNTDAIAGSGGNGGTGVTGGAGGVGGIALGGTSDLSAVLASVVIDNSTFDGAGPGTLYTISANASGGRGGSGADGTGFGDTGGLGGNGGAGTGGTARITANGGQITGFDFALNANGVGGNGGLGGTGASFPGSSEPPQPPIAGVTAASGNGGDGSGGTSAIIVQDAGGGAHLGRITLDNVAMNAVGTGGTGTLQGAFTGGLISVRDESLVAAGSLFLDSLNAQAGIFNGGGFDFFSDTGAVQVAGNVDINVGGQVRIAAVGSGGLVVGGTYTGFNFSDVLITHDGQPASGPQFATISAAQFNSESYFGFVADEGSHIVSSGGIDIVNRYFDSSIADMVAFDRIAVQTGGNLNIGSALVTAPANADGNLVFGGTIRLAAGVQPFGAPGPNGEIAYDPFDLTINDTVKATASVNLFAGADVIVQDGASVLSDNRITASSGDDILVRSGGLMRAAENPLPGGGSDPRDAPARLELFAGTLFLPVANDPSNIASVIVDGAIAAPGRAISILGDAVQVLGAPIASRDLFVDVNTPPAAGDPQLDDNGALSVDCVQGNICLSNILATGVVAIGQGGERPIAVDIGIGDIAAEQVAISAREAIRLGGASTTNYSGSTSLLLDSLGDVELRGNTNVSGGILQIVAGRSLLGTGNLSGGNDVGITVGDSIFANSIIAGREITSAANVGGALEGIFTVPGDFIVGTVGVGLGGGPFALTTGGAIDIGSTTGGFSIDLVAGTSAFVGSAGGDAISIEGESVGFGTLLATTINLLARTGGVDGGTLNGGFSTVQGGSIAIASLLGGDASLQSASTQVTTADLTGSLSVTGGAIDLGTIAADGSVFLDAGSSDILFDSVTSGTGFDAFGGTLTGGTVETGGNANFTIAGQMSIVGVTTTGEFGYGDISFNNGGLLSAGTLDAFEDIIGSAGGLTGYAPTARGEGGAVLIAGGDIDMAFTGDALVASANAGNNLSLSATGGLEFGTFDAGADIDASAGGLLTGDRANALGAIVIGAGGDVGVTSLTSGLSIATNAGGTTDLGTLSSGSTIAIVSTGNVTGLATVTAAGDIEIDGQAGVTGGNFTSTGGELDIEAVGDVTLAQVSAGNEFTVSTTGGGVSVGSAIAGLVDVPPSPGNRRSIGITAFGDVALGTGEAAFHIGLASQTGSVTTGALTAGGTIGIFANNNVATGAIDAGTLFFVGNVSQLATLGPDYDPAALLFLTPTAIGGDLTVNGLIDAGNVALASSGATLLGDVQSGGYATLFGGTSLTAGAIDAQGSVDLRTVSGPVAFDSVATTGYVSIYAGGAINGNSIASEDGFYITGPGDITLASLTSSQGAGFVGVDGDIDIDAVSTGFTFQAFADGNATFGTVATTDAGAPGDSQFANIDIGANGSIDIGSATAADNIFLAAGVGVTGPGPQSITVGSASAGGDFRADAPGLLDLGAIVTRGEYETGYGGEGAVTSSDIVLTTRSRVALGSGTSAEDIIVTATGALNSGALVAVGNIDLNIGGIATLTNLTAGSDIQLTARSATLGAARAGDDISFTINGPVAGGSLTATDTINVQAAGLIDFTLANAGTTLGLRSTGANAGIDVRTARAGTTATINSARAATIATGIAGTDFLVTTTGDASLGSIRTNGVGAGTSDIIISSGGLFAGTLNADDDITITATGGLTGFTPPVPTLVPPGTGDGGAVLIAGRDIDITIGGDALIASATARRDIGGDVTGALTFGSLDARGFINTNSGGATLGNTATAVRSIQISAGLSGLTLGTVTSGTSTVLSSDGTVTLTDGEAGGDFAVNAHDALLGRIVTTGANPARAGNIVLITAGDTQIDSADAFGGIGGNISGDLVATNLVANANIVLGIGGNATLTSATADGGLAVQGGTSVSFGTIDANTVVQIVAAGPVTGTSVTSGGNLIVSTTGDIDIQTATATVTADLAADGAISVGTGQAGDDFLIDAGGIATLTSLTTTGLAVDGTSDIIVSNAGAVAAGRLDAFDNVSITTAGDLGGIPSPFARGEGGAVLVAGDNVGLDIGGIALISTASAGLDITIQADRGLEFGTLTAGGGIGITAFGDLAGDSANAGGAILIGGTNGITIDTVVAGTDVTFSPANTGIDVGSLTAGGVALLDSDGDIAVDTGLSAGNFTARAGGAADLGQIRSTAGAIAITSGGATALDNGNAFGTIGIDATGTLVAGPLTAGTDIVLDFGSSATLGLATAGDDIFLTGSGTLDFVDLDAGDQFLATIGGAVTGGDASSGGLFVLRSTGAGVSLASVTSGGNAGITAATDLVIDSITAAFTATLTAGGAIDVGTGQAGGDFSVDAGSTATLGSIVTTGTAIVIGGEGGTSNIIVRSGDATAAGTLDAFGSVTINAGTDLGGIPSPFARGEGGAVLVAGDGITVNTGGDALIASANAGLNIAIVTAGGLEFGTLDAGTGIGITSGAGIAGDRADAGGAIGLTAANGIVIDALTAGGSISASAGSEGIDFDTVNAGDLAFLTSTGNVTVTTGRSAGNFTVQAGGDANLGRITTTGSEFGYGADIGVTAGGNVTGMFDSATGITVNAASADLTSLTANGAIALTTTGTLDVGTANAGGTFNAGAGDVLNIGSLFSQGFATVTGGSAVTVGQIVTPAGGTFSAGGDLIVAGLRSRGLLTLDGFNVTVQSNITDADDLAITTQNNLTLANVTLDGDLGVDVPGAFSAGTITSGGSITADAGAIDLVGAIAARTVDLTATGAIGVDTGRAGDDFLVDAGTDATLGSIVTTGALIGDDSTDGFSNIILTAGRNVAAGTLNAFDTVSVTATGNLAGIPSPIARGEGGVVLVAGADMDINTSAALIASADAGRDINIVTRTDLEFGTLDAGRNIGIQSAGNVLGDNARAVGTILVRAAGNADIVSLTTTGGEFGYGADISIFADGDVIVGTGTAAGNFLVDAEGNANLGSITTTSNEFGYGAGITVDASALTGGSLTAADGIGVTAASADLTSAMAGRNIGFTTTGALTLGTANAGGTFDATAGGVVDIASLTSQGFATVSGGSAVTVGQIVTPVGGTFSAVDDLIVGGLNSGGLLRLSGFNVTVQSDITDADDLAITTQNNLTLANVTLTGDFGVTVPGIFTGGTITSGGSIFADAGTIDLVGAVAAFNVDLRATAAISVGTGQAGGDFLVDAGTDATLGSIVTTGAAVGSNGEGGDGDIVVASGGATAAGTLNAFGSVSIDAGTDLAGLPAPGARGEGGSVLISGNGITVNTGGDALIASADAGLNIAITTTGGLEFGTLDAGTGIGIQSGGGVAGDSATAGSTIGVNAGALGIDITTLTAGDTAFLSSTGDVTIATGQSAGSFTVQAGGDAILGQITTTGSEFGYGADIAVTATGAVTGAGFDSATDISVNAASANVTTATANGDIGFTLTGALTLGTANAGGTFDATAGGVVDIASLTSQGFATVSGGSAVTVGQIVTPVGGTFAAVGDLIVGGLNSGGLLTLSGFNVTVQSDITDADDLAITTQNNLTLANVTLTGDFGVDVPGAFTAGTITSGGSIRADAGSIDLAGAIARFTVDLGATGAISVDTGRAGDDFLVDAGTTATLGSIVTTGAGLGDDDRDDDGFSNIIVAAGGDVGAASLNAFDAVSIDAAGNLLGAPAPAARGEGGPVLTAGDGISVSTGGDALIASADAGLGISILTGGGLEFGTLDANNAITITSGTFVSGDRANAGGAIGVTSTGLNTAGGITIDALTAGDDIVASAGLAGIDLGSATAGTTVRLTSTGDIMVDTGLAAGNFTVNAGGNVDLGSITTTASEFGYGSDIVITSGGTIFAEGATTLDVGNAFGSILIDSNGNVTSGQLTARRDINVEFGGLATIGTATAGDDIFATGTGTFRATSLTTTGVGPAGDAGGPDVILMTGGAIEVGRIASAQDILLTSTGGAVTVSTDITAGGLIDATGQMVSLTAIDLLDVNSVTATAGNVALRGGDVLLRTASATADLLVASAGTIDVLTDLSIGRRIVFDAAGAINTLDLTANGSIATSSTGGTITLQDVESVGGMVRVGAVGDIQLGDVRAAGSIIVLGSAAITAGDLTAGTGPLIDGEQNNGGGGTDPAVPGIAPGFDDTPVTRCDDCFTGSVPLSFLVNYFGNTYDNTFVSTNGYLTFGAGQGIFTPRGLAEGYAGLPIIAAFFADVDTRNPGSAPVVYGNGQFAGREAFGVTWENVGYFANQADKLNTFQLILTNRTDTGAGNFDIYYNYANITWETGSASGGVNGFGGVSAAVGYNAGTGNQPGTFFELPGSRVPGSFLNNGPLPLITGTNNGNPSQLMFSVRNGQVMPGGPSGPPTVQVSNVSTGNTAAINLGNLSGEGVEVHGAGAVNVGNVSAGDRGSGIEPGGPGYATVIDAATNLSAGNIQSTGLIALGTTLGDLTAGTLTSASSVAVLSDGAIVLGAVTTGQDAGDSLFISSPSIIASDPALAGFTFNNLLDSEDFDPDVFASLTAVPGAGTVTINGPVSTGNLIAAATGAIVLGRVDATNAITLDGGATVTGTDFTAGGAIDIAAIGDVTGDNFIGGTTLTVGTAGRFTADFAGTTGTTGSGDVAIDAANGIAIVAGSATGGIVLTSNAGNVTVGSLATVTGDGAGDIAITANGTINLTGGVTARGALSGNAGSDITIANGSAISGIVMTSNAGNVTVGNLVTVAGAGAGDIAITAGGDINVTGSVNARGALSGNAGSDIAIADGSAISGIVLTSNAGNVTVGNLATVAGPGAGDIAITANGTINLTGGVTARGALSGNAGSDIVIADGSAISGIVLTSNAGNVTVGSLATVTGDGAGDIAITAGGDIDVTGGVNARGALSGNAGSDIAIANGSAISGIVLTSNTGDVTVGGLATVAGAGAGDIAINAGGSINFNGRVNSRGALSGTAGNLIRIAGLADALTITLLSSDIQIGATAQLGSAGKTTSVDITNNGGGRTFIGGNGGNAGYDLSGAELARIFSNDISIHAPSAQVQNPGSVGSTRAPDVIVGAFTLTSRASAQNGNLGAAGKFRIDTTGKLRVVGSATFNGLGSDNDVEFVATDALEVDTAAGSILLNGATGLAGTLMLESDDVFVGTMTALADVAAAADTDAIDARLALNDGNLDEAGAIQAGGLEVRATNGFFVQNSGVESRRLDDRRGFTVGTGGLTIRTGDATTRIVINGREMNPADGGFFTGIDLIPRVTITGLGTGQGTGQGTGETSGAFDLRSTINGCLIANTAGCIIAPVFPVQDVIDDINDPGSVTIDPIDSPLIELRDFERFGFQPLIDEPVTGAGNDDLWSDECIKDPKSQGCPMEKK